MKAFLFFSLSTLSPLNSLPLGSLLLSIGVLVQSSHPHTLSSTSSPLALQLTFLTGIVLTVILSTHPHMTTQVHMALISALLIGVFHAQTPILFYLLFEATTLPMAGVILGWGPQPERLTATAYMLFYTLSSSLPMLLLFLGCYRGYFWMYSPYFFPSTLLISLPLLVKTPTYLTHLWLPKAHVEAPVYGSMVLAGVLLKMGGYGIWKVLIPNPTLDHKILAPASLIGGILASVVTVVQEDMKAMIAYSSVVHMSLSTYTLFHFQTSLQGSVSMMLISHGISSSGLFYVSYVGYMGSGTRSLLMSTVPIWGLPSLAAPWTILVLMNMGVPPSLNFFSEYLLLITPIMSSWLWGVGVTALVSSVVVYSLVLYMLGSHGSSTSSYSTSPQPLLQELASSVSHSSWLVLGPLSLSLFE